MSEHYPLLLALLFLLLFLFLLFLLFLLGVILYKQTIIRNLLDNPRYPINQVLDVATTHPCSGLLFFLLFLLLLLLLLLILGQLPLLLLRGYLFLVYVHRVVFSFSLLLLILLRRGLDKGQGGLFIIVFVVVDGSTLR